MEQADKFYFFLIKKITIDNERNFKNTSTAKRIIQD